MTNWTKVLSDMGIGGLAGSADQLAQNSDEKRALNQRAAGKLAADKKLPIMQQYGTYINYGVPLLAIVGVATGMVKGDMATRVATMGGQLAGRKATHQFTTGATSATPSAAYTQWARQAAMASAARGPAGTAGRLPDVLTQDTVSTPA
jgi:hypothetical protein